MGGRNGRTLEIAGVVGDKDVAVAVAVVGVVAVAVVAVVVVVVEVRVVVGVAADVVIAADEAAEKKPEADAG